MRQLAGKDKQDWVDRPYAEIDQEGEYRIREVYKMVKNITRRWQPRASAIQYRKGRILMDKEKNFIDKGNQRTG